MCLFLEHILIPCTGKKRLMLLMPVEHLIFFHEIEHCKHACMLGYRIQLIPFDRSIYFYKIYFHTTEHYMCIKLGFPSMLGLIILSQPSEHYFV